MVRIPLSLKCTSYTNFSSVYLHEQEATTANPERLNPIYNPDILVDEEITGQ